MQELEAWQFIFSSWTKATGPCNTESRSDFRGKWEYRCVCFDSSCRGAQQSLTSPHSWICSDRNSYRGFLVGARMGIPGTWEEGKWRGCLNLGPIRQHSMARLGFEVWILEWNGMGAHSHLQQSACPVFRSLLLPTSDGNIHLLQPCCRSPDHGYSGHCCWA